MLNETKLQNFVDYSNKIIIENKESLRETLVSVIEKIRTKSELTANEVHVLGAVFVQVLPQKFLFGDLNEEALRMIADSFNEFEQKYQVSIKNEFEELMNLETPISDELYKMIESGVKSAEYDYDNQIVLFYPNTRIQYDETIVYNTIYKILKLSQFPMSQAVNVYQYYAFKKDYTAEDIIKLNTLINTIATFNGEALVLYNQLYADTIFLEICNQAVDLHNAVKYQMIFNEYILAAFEKMKSYQYHCYNTFKFSLDEIQFQNIMMKSVSEENEEDKKQEDTDQILSNPFRMLSQVFDEVVPTEFESFEDRLKYFCNEYLLKNNRDAIADFTTYFGNASKNIEEYTTIEVEQEVIEAVSKFNKELLEEYKTLSESVCSEIGLVEDTNKINKLVRDVIKVAIISTSEQKMYLSQQLNENCISTWNHFTEMMEQLETCSVDGMYTSKFNHLVDWVKKNTKYEMILEDRTKLEDLQMILTFMSYLKQFVTLLKERKGSE